MYIDKVSSSFGSTLPPLAMPRLSFFAGASHLPTRSQYATLYVVFSPPTNPQPGNEFY